MKQHENSAYAPYRKEANTCLVIDSVIAVSIVLLLLLARAGWFILLILPLFALGTFILNYLPTLRLRREMKDELFETAAVEILEVRELHSAAGYWGTVLKEIYPKALRVSRYKLLCRDEKGEKLALQCVMSEQKQQLLRDGIDRKQLTHCTVSYGKNTRILQAFCDRGQLTDSLNQKL